MSKATRITKISLYLDLMRDQQWHYASELVREVSHRFSAIQHRLSTQGYVFAVRYDKQKRERKYRLMGIESKK